MVPLDIKGDDPFIKCTLYSSKIQFFLWSDSNVQSEEVTIPVGINFHIRDADTILRYDSAAEAGSKSKERPVIKENVLA